MRAISPFSLEAGTSILAALPGPRSGSGWSCPRWDRSCSWGITSRLGLPARLDDAGDVARERQLAEADAAHLELPQVRPGAAAGAAAVVLAHPELRLAIGLGDQR